MKKISLINTLKKTIKTKKVKKKKSIKSLVKNKKPKTLSKTKKTKKVIKIKKVKTKTKSNSPIKSKQLRIASENIIKEEFDENSCYGYFTTPFLEGEHTSHDFDISNGEIINANPNKPNFDI